MWKRYDLSQYDYTWDFLSGGVAGIISKTIVAPIERVKLLMQTQHQNAKITLKYNGIIDCFTRCYRQDGILAFWRGNWANVVRYFPTQSLNFSFKDYFNRIFPVKQSDKQSNKLRYLQRKILNGGMAGALTTLFVHPLDFARTRLGVDLGKQKSSREFTGLSDCLRSTYRKEGIRGLYRGLAISLPSIFLYRGLYFGFYDTGKDLFLSPNSNILVRFFWAQISVILSETISYPGDTIKRKLMMQSLKEVKQYNGALDCFQKVYKSEGLKGLWSGAFTNMFRSIGSSLCLVLYDQLVKKKKKIQ